MMIILTLILCAGLSLAVPVEETHGLGYERIITDYEDTRIGVPVDFRYNESSKSADGGFTSVPGCPKSEAGYPWVYYGTQYNRKCYLAGEQGPCIWGQKIFLERGSPYGFCNCDCFEGIKRQGGPDQVQFCKSTEYVPEFAFLPDIKKCHLIFEQGPCNEDEWLVKVEGAYGSPPSVRCGPRTCRAGLIPDVSKSNDNFKNAKIECISPFIPQPPAPAYGTANVGGNSCPPDMKYSSLLKKCVRKFNFAV